MHKCPTCDVTSAGLWLARRTPPLSRPGRQRYSQLSPPTSLPQPRSRHMSRNRNVKSSNTQRKTLGETEPRVSRSPHPMPCNELRVDLPDGPGSGSKATWAELKHATWHASSRMRHGEKCAQVGYAMSNSTRRSKEEKGKPAQDGGAPTRERIRASPEQETERKR